MKKAKQQQQMTPLEALRLLLNDTSSHDLFRKKFNKDPDSFIESIIPDEATTLIMQVIDVEDNNTQLVMEQVTHIIRIKEGMNINNLLTFYKANVCTD